MTQLILDDEQVETIAQALGTLELCDQRGNILGYVAPRASQEEIAEAKRRLTIDGPRHTTQQVLARLKALEQE